jgi:pimeloyl-ACP methyl ester carboxylesterase
MTTATAVRINSLDVPGATLYYEVRGSGPALLMIPGGPADATAFRDVAQELASNYTVITYDPRDLSNSTAQVPTPSEKIVETYADDAHRLLAAVTKEPAFVLASSGGCAFALELATRHPEQLRAVIVHEPPMPSLQPDPARIRAEMADIVSTFKAQGIGPAMGKFMVHTRIKGGPPPAPDHEPTPEELAAQARFQRNMEFWLGTYFQAIANYEPDLATLKTSPVRFIPGVGDESGGELAHDGGIGLGQQLGTDAVVFPGAHGGFGTHPRQFAVKLREVLEG